MNHAKTGKDCKASYLFPGSSTLKITMAKSMYCIAEGETIKMMKQRKCTNNLTKCGVSSDTCDHNHGICQMWGNLLKKL